MTLGRILVMQDSDLSEIRKALSIAKAKGYRTVKLADGEISFTATFRSGSVRTAPAPAPSRTESEPETPQTPAITSPQVGYFQLSEQELQPGQEVEEGMIIGTIVALELANEIRMPVTGRIEEVLVADGDPVEYGQTLLTYSSGVRS